MPPARAILEERPPEGGDNDSKEQAMSEGKRVVPRTVAMGAVVLGLAAGSYGVAAAATGASTQTTTTGAAADPRGGHGPPGAGRGAHPGETALTGDALAKVTAVAQAKVPGGTIVRVENDSDGNAAYEAHMTDASGARVTVYVDKSFAFVKLETRNR
jgi:hypothetical protein